jgi:type I restriction enzyme R subunit
VVFDDAAFREYVDTVRRKYEQIIDTVNTDTVTFAGFSADATDQAQGVVDSFRAFIAANRDSFTRAADLLQPALPPQGAHLPHGAEVAEALQRPPYNLTTERVWAAYERAMNLKTDPSA